MELALETGNTAVRHGGGLAPNPSCFALRYTDSRRTGRRPSADRTESTCMKLQFRVLTNLLLPAAADPGMT